MYFCFVLYILFRSVSFKLSGYRLTLVEWSTATLLTITLLWEFLPCWNTIYHIIPYHTIPYHTEPYHTIPYQTIPYHTIPYQTMPHRIIPCGTVPYHTVPYHIIPSKGLDAVRVLASLQCSLLVSCNTQVFVSTTNSPFLCRVLNFQTIHRI